MKKVVICYKNNTYNTDYYISVLGEVYRNGKKLKPINNRYLYVNIYYEKNKSTPQAIHRLVAFAYIENPDKKTEVNHINGNKHDNRALNLEWVTPKENTAHAIKNGLSKVKTKEVLKTTLWAGWHKNREKIISNQKIRVAGESNPNAKITFKQAVLIRKEYNSGEFSVKELAGKYNVVRQTIEAVLLNKRFIDNSYIQPKRLREIYKIQQLKNGKILNTFNNASEAARFIGDIKYRSGITAVCRGRRNQTKGYFWQYLKD